MKKATKLLSALLAVIMLVGVLPLSALASVTYYGTLGDDYYNVISKQDWTLAPGIEETEIVLNNDAGTRRQVLHTVTVDMNSEYTKVISGYKGMIPDPSNYGTESTSVQAKNAEALGYGHVVAATNATLSWYTAAYYTEHPELIGEPLGYTILDGYYYENSNGGTYGANNVIVINYDNHPITGEARPEDVPKVWIRSTSDLLTGWEEQAIPVQFDMLVKPDEDGNPVNLYASQKDSVKHGSSVAARTFVGVKADGTLVVVMCDGEQAPYSTGFTTYEMADYMIKMGCVIAANCDGGGSSAFCSQRPGEDFQVNCSLADGGERPTTHTILIISTAPADGEFARATISSDYSYYTPGSTVTFSALGTDAVGTKVDIPDDVEWQIKEEDMGTISNGVFVSNGTIGTVTAQMVYEGTVVGECAITIAIPDALSFDQSVINVPFGKTVTIPVKATINGVAYEIGMSSDSLTFTTTNAAIGTINGLNFTAVSEANAPANLEATLTATLNMGTNPSADVTIKLGKGSVVLWDFENGRSDINEWNVINNRKGDHWEYDMKLSLADATNGQVHDGQYSMRLEVNGLSSKDSHSEQYAYIRLGVDGDAIVLENAKSVGFWMYVPEDNIQCWVQGYYRYDSNGNGVLDDEDAVATVSMMDSENVYYNIDESGWHYLSMDISAYNEVALKYSQQFDKDADDGTDEKGEFFIAIIFHKAINNKLWSDNGSIIGPYTYYFDSFTVDYSDAVDDRENPVFDKVYLDDTALVKRDVVTTTNNILNLSVAVADATTKADANNVQRALNNVSGLDETTAKAYIDGVEVASTFADGKITVTGLAVADGYHRVKFEISDKAGNKSVIIRVIKVNSGVEASTVQLVPADATLDRILFGSLYWMNLEANAIETIQSVSTVIDLNNVNHWELDHMELAEGFTAIYSIDEETNTATITIKRTGENTQTGSAVLAKLPLRILYYDTDIAMEEYTAETYWTEYTFWAQDLKVDVDMGEITYVDGYTSDVLNAFSNEEFHVDTEMYTNQANMDADYFKAHGTTHVHTIFNLPDQSTSCSSYGYTGRTYCEVCNSVVDWGTITEGATGHAYKVSGDKLVCDCGKEFTGTGFVTAGGVNYYVVNGTLQSGWVGIGDDWYYFDETTYSSVSTYYNGYVTFKFEEDGKLTSGEWHKSSAGIRYYIGPSYLRGGKSIMTWYEIDGKTYCFDKSGYAATGTRWINDVNGKEYYTWYVFGEDGVCQERWMYSGLAEWNGSYYYLKDGVSAYGMYLVDGAYYYFYFTNYYGGIQNQTFYCHYNNGLLPDGYYTFGADAKMLNNVVYDVSGVLYYYVLGNLSQGSGSIEINGQEWAIESDGKVLFTGFFKDSNGDYQYYENGVKSGSHTWNEGVITTPASCSVYGVMTYTCRDCGEQKTDTIAKLDHVDENEDYICDGCRAPLPHTHTWDDGVVTTPATCTENGIKTYTCKCGETKTESVEAIGHHIDENGDLVCDYCAATLSTKTGLVFDSDGEIRYYVNGVADRAGLVQDSAGNYYYINSSVKAVKNCTYAFSTAMSNGLLPSGTYRFGADGKMIDPPTGTSHIHTWSEGTVTAATCESDGVMTYICACGLSKAEVITATGHIDANGDYKCDSCGTPFAHDHVWDSGIVTTPATCTDEGVKTYTCKCGETKTETITATGHVDDNEDYICDVCKVPISHVHKWDDGVVTTPATCTEEGVKTYTCKCSETKTESIAKTEHDDRNGDYKCDSCGTPFAHDHIWDDGVVTTPATCTNNGIKTYTCKCGETKTETGEAVGHHIDENGDLVCDYCAATLSTKTGLVFDSDGEIRYYVNGVADRAGLVQDSAGNYYYINSSVKAVKNCTYAFSTAMSNGLLPSGTYRFGADGKMINPPTGTSHVHTWGEGAVTTTAGCESDGVMTYICACGLSKAEVIMATGHVDVNGDYKCDSCGTPFAHDHVWDSGTVTTPVTCTEDGVKTYTCKCGETKTETITATGHVDDNEDYICDVCKVPISHVHKWDDGVVTTPATCTEEGVKTYTCKCSETKTESIAKTEHDDRNGDYKCDSCGTPFAHDHIWDDGVVTTPATCTNNGIKTYTCKCGETKTETVEAVGHHIDENGDLVCDYCAATLSTKTGLVFDSDGEIRYYVNGVADRAGLVQDSAGNYYYINSSVKAVKNCTYAFSTAMSNGLLPGGTYQFDADGKLILND